METTTTQDSIKANLLTDTGDAFHVIFLLHNFLSTYLPFLPAVICRVIGSFVQSGHLARTSDLQESTAPWHLDSPAHMLTYIPWENSLDWYTNPLNLLLTMLITIATGERSFSNIGTTGQKFQMCSEYVTYWLCFMRNKDFTAQLKQGMYSFQWRVNHIHSLHLFNDDEYMYLICTRISSRCYIAFSTDGLIRPSNAF